jgi:hypothetical protein
VQSPATVQPEPLPHVGQPPPPQSLPVSVPFWRESVQVAGLHVLSEPQFLFLQSVPTTQASPSGHGAQLGPPQSLSVSWPFNVPSPQPGGVQSP